MQLGRDPKLNSCDSRVSESTRSCLVPSFNNSTYLNWYVYLAPIKASIIIPTTRKEALARCLASLEAQDEQDFEVIPITEKGSLAKLRNQGWKKASAQIVIFIDDDTVCTPSWLSSILLAFDDPKVGGVSGPSIIREEIQGNRDLFRFKWIKRVIYDWFFCEGKALLPGYVLDSGAWTTGACNEACQYEGEVDFLEACNQAYRKSLLTLVGGFSEDYLGVGDWSEPDLSYRIKETGHKLLFVQGAKLYHEVSQSGAYTKRIHDDSRYTNYLTFAKRHIKRRSWKFQIYLLFLRCYFMLKRMQLV